MKNKKKILQVFSSTNRGGAETLIMNLYRNIDKEEIQFDFLVFSEKSGDYDKEINQLGGNVIRIDSIGNSSIFKFIMSVKNEIMRNGPYHAVHTHVNYQNGVIAFSAQLAGVKKIISHSHSSSSRLSNSLKGKAALFFLKKMIKCFNTQYLACSVEAGKFLYGNDFIVIPNAIDLNKFLSNNKLIFKKQRSELLIGHIGRFVKVKNHDFLIRLANYLKKSEIEFKFILIGQGPLREDIQKKVSLYELDSHFMFLGIREDIPDILNSIDIFLLPSYYEGIPLTLIEAQASNTPCVVSNNVDKYVDFGIGLITYLDLDDSLKSWKNAILNAKKCKKNKVYNVIQNSGFDIKKFKDKLLKIYFENSSDD